MDKSNNKKDKEMPGAADESCDDEYIDELFEELADMKFDVLDDWYENSDQPSDEASNQTSEKKEIEKADVKLVNTEKKQRKPEAIISQKPDSKPDQSDPIKDTKSDQKLNDSVEKPKDKPVPNREVSKKPNEKTVPKTDSDRRSPRSGTSRNKSSERRRVSDNRRRSRDRKSNEKTEQPRRDINKTRRDVQRDKDRCAKNLQDKNLKQKADLAATGLVPPGLEDVIVGLTKENERLDIKNDQISFKNCNQDRRKSPVRSRGSPGMKRRRSSERRRSMERGRFSDSRRGGRGSFRGRNVSPPLRRRPFERRRSSERRRSPERRNSSDRSFKRRRSAERPSPNQSFPTPNQSFPTPNQTSHPPFEMPPSQYNMYPTEPVQGYTPYSSNFPLQQTQPETPFYPDFTVNNSNAYDGVPINYNPDFASDNFYPTNPELQPHSSFQNVPNVPIYSNNDYNINQPVKVFDNFTVTNAITSTLSSTGRDPVESFLNPFTPAKETPPTPMPPKASISKIPDDEPKDNGDFFGEKRSKKKCRKNKKRREWLLKREQFLLEEKRREELEQQKRNELSQQREKPRTNSEKNSKDLNKLLETKQISLSDFLSLSAKDSKHDSQHDSFQTKYGVIARCEEAIQILSPDPQFLNHFVPNLNVNINPSKIASHAFKSPLKSRTNKLRFSSKREEHSVSEGMQLLLSKINFSSPTVSTPPPPIITEYSKQRCFGTQTEVSSCQPCLERATRKYVDSATQTYVGCTDSAIQVSPGDFIQRSILKNSMSHLTAAQLRQNEMFPPGPSPYFDMRNFGVPPRHNMNRLP